MFVTAQNLLDHVAGGHDVLLLSTGSGVSVVRCQDLACAWSGLIGESRYLPPPDRVPAAIGRAVEG